MTKLLISTTTIFLTSIIVMMALVHTSVVQETEAMPPSEMFPLITTLDTGMGPNGICSTDATMAPNTDVWVANFFDDTVQVFDVDLKLIRTIDVGDGPMGICVSMTPEGFRPWVPNYLDGTVTLMDRETGTAILTLPTLRSDGTEATAGAAFICATTTPWRIYVSNTLENTVTVIDTSGPVPFVMGKIDVGNHPSGLGVDRVRDLIWVVNSGDDTVMLIDSSAPVNQGAIVATVSVGKNPAGFPGMGIGANRVLGTIAVPNTGDNTVSILDADPNDDGKVVDMAVVATLTMADGILENPTASGAGIATDIWGITYFGSSMLTMIDADPNGDGASDDAAVLVNIDLDELKGKKKNNGIMAPSAVGIQSSSDLGPNSRIEILNFADNSMTVLLDTTGPTIDELADRKSDFDGNNFPGCGTGNNNAVC